MKEKEFNTFYLVTNENIIGSFYDPETFFKVYKTLLSHGTKNWLNLFDVYLCYMNTGIMCSVTPDDVIKKILRKGEK